jgi:hypothetical protein
MEWGVDLRGFVSIGSYFIVVGFLLEIVDVL